MTTYTLTVSTNDLGLGVINGARVVVERRRTQISDIFSRQALTKNTSATNTSGIAVMLLSPDDGSVYHELKIFDLAGIPVYSAMFTMPPQAVALTDLPVGDIISESASQAVAASATATEQAVISTAQAVISTEQAVTATEQAVISTAQVTLATEQAVIATAQAVLTAADRVQTGLDVIATAADRVQTGLDVIDTAAAAAGTVIRKFVTYTEQMAYVGAYVDGQKADVLSYYKLGDGGDIPMFWDAASTATHNSGTVRKPTAIVGAGRWLAVDKNNINVKQFGAKTDGTDSTSYFQAAINFAETNGFVVKVPAGSYTINTTITLKQGVSLIGERTNPYNAAANYPSKIIHAPASSGVNMIELVAPATNTTYVSCGAIENLYLVASENGNTNYGIYLRNPVGARFDNIGASNPFVGGFLAIKGNLNGVFSNFRVSNAAVGGTRSLAAVVMLSWDGHVYSTTARFKNFYVSGSLTAGAGGLTSAFIALPAAGNSIKLEEWTVESITGVTFDIQKGNEVQIVAPYCENLPNANVDTPVIQVGVTGAASAPNNAYDTITSLTVDGQGSTVMQYSQGAATNTVFINADVAQYIIVKDLQLARCVKFIAGTNSTQRLKISNIQAVNVTTFQTGMTPYKIEEEGGCFFNTYVANSINYEVDATKNTMPKSLLKNGGLFVSSDVGTEGALSWLDRADGEFNYTAIKSVASPSNGAWKIGDVVVNSAPAIGKAMGWAATAKAAGGAANWIIRGQFGIASGTTANRPTMSTMGVVANDRWAGTQYLDTTLAANGKLITWNGSAWVDTTGAIV
jgi:hypothetical protein